MKSLKILITLKRVEKYYIKRCLHSIDMKSSLLLNRLSSHYYLLHLTSFTLSVVVHVTKRLNHESFYYFKFFNFILIKDRANYEYFELK